VRSRFTAEARGGVLQGLYAGLTLTEAAERAELPAQTVKNWLTRGRSEIGTEHAVFAAAVDAARESAERAAMTEQEFRGCVNRAVRAGSVQAMRLWWAIRSDDAVDEDPFAGLDDDPITQLARRRMSRLDELDANNGNRKEDP